MSGRASRQQRRIGWPLSPFRRIAAGLARAAVLGGALLGDRLSDLNRPRGP